MTSVPVLRNSVGREVLVVDATAGGVQLTVPAAARHALFSLATANIRMTLDGTAPVSGSPGVLLTFGASGQPVVFTMFMDAQADFHQILTDAKFIREGGTSGDLEVEYFD